MPPAITIHNLGKRYRLGETVTFQGGLRRRVKALLSGKSPDAERKTHVWALRELDLDVPQGQVLGIIGHNGAGKSTLLKILSRITAPTTGEVRIRGRVASLLEVGTGFHHDLTGRENVFLNGSILGMSRREIARKFDAIVAFAELADFIDTPVKRYSTGMYTRLAFAVAAHLEPDVLIVDEVLSVGDAGFQKKCIGKMSDVAGEGRTVLFVSHSMVAVQKLCSRVVLFDHGKMVRDGKPADVVEEYLRITGGAGVEGDAEPGDLATRPRVLAGLGERVRIVACQVLGAGGERATTLRFGEPFTVRTTLRCTHAEPDLSLLIGINAADETRITNDVSEDVKALFDGSPDRPLVLDATFDGTVLTPGTYYITIGVRSGGRGVDKLDRCAKLEITTVAHDGVAPPVGQLGYLRARPAWRVAQP